MKFITSVLTATALLFVSSVAGADILTEAPDAPIMEGVEVLSDADLGAVAGTGLFRDIGCGIADGLAGAGAIVGGAVLIAGATLPPLGVVVISVAGLASLGCAISGLF